jgi:hypothetical protein
VGGGTWVMGKKRRKKKEKRKRGEVYVGGGEKRKGKKKKEKKKKRGNILRVYRRRVEKNEKRWYFESCEKINKIIRIY